MGCCAASLSRLVIIFDNFILLYTTPQPCPSLFVRTLVLRLVRPSEILANRKEVFQPIGMFLRIEGPLA